MTKDEALRLALDTLKEVREETFRLMRNGERLYAEDKVWSTIISIQEVLAQGDKIRPWVVLTDKEIEAIWKVALFADYGVGAELSNQPFVHYARAIEAKLKERNT